MDHHLAFGNSNKNSNFLIDWRWELWWKVIIIIIIIIIIMFFIIIIIRMMIMVAASNRELKFGNWCKLNFWRKVSQAHFVRLHLQPQPVFVLPISHLNFKSWILSKEKLKHLNLFVFFTNYDEKKFKLSQLQGLGGALVKFV